MGIDVTIFGPTYSIDVIVKRKRKGKGKRNPLEKKVVIGYLIRYNLIGRPKAVTSIPILLGLT